MWYIYILLIIIFILILILIQRKIVLNRLLNEGRMLENEKLELEILLKEHEINQQKGKTVVTQYEAIIEAFQTLGGVRTSEEIKAWVEEKYGPRWKDFSTMLADMVPPDHGGNQSSTVSNDYRVLIRVARGNYKLIS